MADPKPIKPSAAAILRSIQKDEQYVDVVRNQVNQLIRLVVGPRSWIRWRHEIEAIATFLYYGATTLNGLQTLGEEYVRIVQIEGNQLKMPSLIVSLLYAIHSFPHSLIFAISHM